MTFDINHNKMRMVKKPIMGTASIRISATFSGKKSIMKIPIILSIIKIKIIIIPVNNSMKNPLKKMEIFFFFINVSFEKWLSGLMTEML